MEKQTPHPRFSPSVVHALARCTTETLQAWLIFWLTFASLREPSPSPFTLHLCENLCHALREPLSFTFTLLPFTFKPYPHASRCENLLLYPYPSTSTPPVSAHAERYPYLSPGGEVGYGLAPPHFLPPSLRSIYIPLLFNTARFSLFPLIAN